MIVNLKQVCCSKAGCSNLFWIDETWQGLYWCSDACQYAELEGAPTTAAADTAAEAADAAAIAVFNDESPSAGVNLEGGTDETSTNSGSIPDVITLGDDGVG